MRHTLRKLLRELHRRSIWQVGGIYLAGSWGVLQVVDYMTGFAGLPSWTPSFAFVLLLIGLPIVLATAFIQEGVPQLSGEYEDEVDPTELEGRTPQDVHQDPDAHPLHRARLFTWRNATLGGVGAGALLVAAVVAYLVMWALGIGPVGSLVAQGVLDVRDPVILADFQDRTGDGSLADAVTDAFRVDLVESQVVTLVDGRMVQDALQRMGRGRDAALTPEVAREVAVREGIKAVVQGEVSRVGAGYLLAASIVVPDDGHTIAAFRESADGDADLLPAIDRLSQRVREKAGESLREVRAGQPLEAVTTSSLDALRKLAEAHRASDRGDVEGAIDRLREAVALDPGFAMAWRFLAVVLSNRGGDRDAMVEAATKAWENRDRLTERERDLAEAWYNYGVTGDQDEVVRAYRAVLARHPDDAVALNNLAVSYQDREQWSDAVELLRRAVSGPARSPQNFNNLVLSLYNTGAKEEALQVLEQWREIYPQDFSYFRQRTGVLWGMGRYDEAMAVLDSGIVSLEDDPVGRLRLVQRGDQMALARGHLRDAERRARQGAAETEARGIAPGVFIFTSDLVDIRLVEGGDTLGELRRLDRRATELFADVPPLNRPYGTVATYWILYGRDADRAEHWWNLLRDATPDAVKSGRSFANDELYRQQWLALLRGRPEEALQDLRELQRRDPCAVCRTRELAAAFEALQQPDSAIAHLEQWVAGDHFSDAIVRETSLEAVLPALARLYEEVGRDQDAAATWLRFADHWTDADDVLQPRVDAARKRAEELSAGDG